MISVHRLTVPGILQIVVPADHAHAYEVKAVYFTMTQAGNKVDVYLGGRRLCTVEASIPNQTFLGISHPLWAGRGSALQIMARSVCSIVVAVEVEVFPLLLDNLEVLAAAAEKAARDNEEQQ